MRSPTGDEIAARLIGIISDGFNRSLGRFSAPLPLVDSNSCRGVK